jgi:hypothetical protein
VRCLDAPGEAGINRTAWDLTEEAPVAWLRARDWNRGASGPTAVPGRYTIRMRAALRQAQGDKVVDQTLEVRADPRAHWTQSQYVARHVFVKTLDDELSAIDVALNRLDALKGRPGVEATRALFTSGVVNSEDDQLMPDRLRERLTILQGVIALSQGPPLPPHYREAAAIRAQYDAAMAAYRAFLEKYRLPADAPREVCRE